MSPEARSPSPPLRQDPRLDRDAQALHDAVSELIRIYQFRDRERVGDHGLSVTQCRALETMVNTEDLSMNDLAASLFLDKSTTSRVVDALERKGLASRQPNPKDRRGLLIRATNDGQELLEEVRAKIIADERRLLAEFEPAIRKEMTRLISRLSEAAAARVDTTGGTCSTIG